MPVRPAGFEGMLFGMVLEIGLKKDNRTDFKFKTLVQTFSLEKEVLMQNI